MNTKTTNLSNQKYKILVMGPIKHGKTWFAHTFPKPIYYFDFDDGMTTLVVEHFDAYYDTFVDTDMKHPQAYIGALKQLDAFEKSSVEHGKVIYESENGPVDISTIVLDGSTALHDAAMNFRDFKLNRAGKAVLERDYQTDFGPQISMYTNFVKRLRVLPCHVVVNCHEHRDVAETGESVILPLVTGKVSRSLGKDFDAIFRAECNKRNNVYEYRLLTKPKSVFIYDVQRKTNVEHRIEVGNRYGDSLNEYEKPDFNEIYKKFEAYREKKAKEDEEKRS